MLLIKQYLNRMHLCVLVIGVAWAALAGPSDMAAQNPNNFDTPNIMQALQTPHSDLVLLSAHRGIHALAGLSQAPDVPENSLQSIDLAAEGGWEMIELDVKSTSDGVPILSHDKSWGREWCGLSPFPFGQRYDPFTPPGNAKNDSTNPLVANTSLSNTRSSLGETELRDSVSLVTDTVNHGCTPGNAYYGVYPPTLADALNEIRNKHIRMVVMLDIQDLGTAEAAWNIVQSMSDDVARPFWESTIFKMPAMLFTTPNTNTASPSVFEETFGGEYQLVNFIPVFTTGSIAPLVPLAPPTGMAPYSPGFGSEAGIIAYLNAFEATTIPIPAVEVGLKETGGILTSVLNAARTGSNGLPKSIGQFSPVGEYYHLNGDTSNTPYFFRSVNGTCCDTLNAYLYNNPNQTGPIYPGQPVDNSDQRTNLSFIISSNNQYVITDDPTGLATALGTAKRRICYMQIGGCGAPPPTPTIAIDSGSSTASGGFLADTDFNGGSTKTTNNAITVPANVASIAPAAEYQTARQGGSFSYVLPGFPPNSTGNSVSLLFAELYFSATGQRVFNVQVGTAGTPQLLTNFDIVQAAGGPYTAVVKSFYNVTADANGAITILFSQGTTNQPSVNGILAYAGPANGGTSGGGTSTSGGGFTGGSGLSTFAIASGSTAPIGNFVADTDFTGGSVKTVTHLVTVPAQYASVAPEAVYQTGRQGTFTYVIPGFAPNSTTNEVGMLFAELYYSNTGQRVFNVQIGTAGTVQYLNNFDIVQAAGAPMTAVAELFSNVTADANGDISIIFTGGTAAQPLVSGILVAGVPASGGSGSVGSTGGGASGNGSTISQQIAVPAYFYPTPGATQWSQLSQIAGGIAIANVSNGPNYGVDPNYATVIQQTHAAGVKVLGYVDTGYFGGTTPARTTRLNQTDVNSWTTQIEQDVDGWYGIYGANGIDGIFFDDGQNVCGAQYQYVTLYTDIMNYVKQNHPGAYVVTNPGTAVPQCLQNIADTLVTFEGTYLCYINDPSCPAGNAYAPLTWSPVDPKETFHIVYGLPAASLASASALSKQRNAGYVFLTDATLAGNPYGSMPSYLSLERSYGPAGGTPDATVPTAPGALSTTYAFGSSVGLTWTPSTDANGSGVVGYDVYQNGIKTMSVPGNLSQATITGLTPSTVYSYYVVARNVVGTASPESLPHNVLTAQAGSSVTAPTITSTVANSTDAVITWTPAQAGAYPLAYYDVFTNGKKVITVDAGVLSADVIQLIATYYGQLYQGGTWNIAVQARDAQGDVSPMSNTVAASTTSPPVPPPCTVGIASGIVTIGCNYNEPWGFHHVYIDADNKSTTGYLFNWTTPEVGADYLIENTNLEAYAGNGTTFSWSPIATVQPVVTGSDATGFTYTWSVPLSAFTGVPIGPTSLYLLNGTGYVPEAYAGVLTCSSPSCNVP